MAEGVTSNVTPPPKVPSAEEAPIQEVVPCLKKSSPPEVGVVSNTTPPPKVPSAEVVPAPPKVPPAEVAPKKPRKPRQPKVTHTPGATGKLAAVSPSCTPHSGPAEAEPKPSKEALTLEFWAGLMQTQKVVMAQRKTERYNSFRIV